MRRLSRGFLVVSSIARNSVSAYGRDHGQADDEWRAEPVVLVTFLEDCLKSRRARSPW